MRMYARAEIHAPHIYSIQVTRHDGVTVHHACSVIRCVPSADNRLDSPPLCNRHTAWRAARLQQPCRSSKDREEGSLFNLMFPRLTLCAAAERREVS